MKIMMIMKWDGVTSQQYDNLRGIVKWETDHPKGALFHAAAFDNDGIRVTDLWESAEEFNSFVHERLMPGTAQLGIAGQPQVEICPLHSIFVPDAQKLKL
ncbi:MAG TPA: hypothetical protein VKH37_04165 [Ferruginibacter sp.]|nr:hypothetical protein [Ferruginibacter sp.]